ncbi:MAG: lycopene cyclase domain-containing protein [Desulfobacterota bacterium]|nr:lycopene cyclase domain-containing protein [Thermodesulfobacteriota bacterium]
MYYNFLIIATLFSLPGLIIWLCRKDLRPVITRMVPLALPFTFTEFLFFPDYWEPRFLFDLGERVGFGIEDFIFVAGLAAFTTTAYAVFNRKRYLPLEIINNAVIMKRCSSLFGLTVFLVATTVLLDIPIIYGSCATMMLVAAAIIAVRRDLLAPACLGALYSIATYYVVCVLCLIMIPDLFQTVWHSERFSKITVGGVPLEELCYGGAAGFCATVVYPYLFRMAFAPLTGEGRHL